MFRLTESNYEALDITIDEVNRLSLSYSSLQNISDVTLQPWDDTDCSKINGATTIPKLVDYSDSSSKNEVSVIYYCIMSVVNFYLKQGFHLCRGISSH